MESFEEAKERMKGVLADEAERAIEEHAGFRFGQRVVILEDGDPTAGPFEGEEGYVVIQEVGAPEYGNVRIDFSVMTDGTDCPMEIEPRKVEAI